MEAGKKTEGLVRAIKPEDGKRRLSRKKYRKILQVAKEARFPPANLENDFLLVLLLMLLPYSAARSKSF